MTGRSPDGSGHSAEPEPISVVSAETASVPNAGEAAARCLWCESYEASVDESGLCEMCREPEPSPRKTFDTSVIAERLGEIDARFLEPLIKKAADNFYCQVLDAVDDYLIENLDHNMSSHIRMLERENQQMRTELWEVDRTLSCLSLGHKSRLEAIKQNQREFNRAADECWRLRAELASAIKARSDATPKSGAAEGESAGSKDDAHA